MNKGELYGVMVDMVPVKLSEKDDFRDTLNKTLRTYHKLLGTLDEVDRPAHWDDARHRVVQLINGINRAVEREYQGTRHSAYAVIKNQLDGYKTQRAEIKGLAIDKNILTVPRGTVTYRMRKVNLEEYN